ncbi:hypothetical protein M8818_002761 [Zalaria obscura]|uniref:Uncharacterized protein n=1 Tax=Zalaria obscura TaxID=2024903 RepID=A0ACC3SHF8_9PEZI
MEVQVPDKLGLDMRGVVWTRLGWEPTFRGRIQASHNRFFDRWTLLEARVRVPLDASSFAPFDGPRSGNTGLVQTFCAQQMRRPDDAGVCMRLVGNTGGHLGSA